MERHDDERPVFRPGEARSDPGTPTIGVGSGALRPYPPRPRGDEHWKRYYGVDTATTDGLARIWRKITGRRL